MVISAVVPYAVRTLRSFCKLKITFLIPVGEFIIISKTINTIHTRKKTIIYAYTHLSTETKLFSQSLSAYQLDHMQCLIQETEELLYFIT